MRVLWFTNTPANYSTDGNTYNGGGWISSLEKKLSKNQDFQLAIAFNMDGQPFKVSQNNVIYYPIKKRRLSLKLKILSLIGNKEQIEKSTWDSYICDYVNVVSDFKPDIIQVFGSERHFGLVSKAVSIPVVLHIQGVLNPYFNAFLPPFVSWSTYFFQSFSLKKIFDGISTFDRWKRDCFREKEILSNVKYYIGRTSWDYAITKVYNPNSCYYYGSEILRDAFYSDFQRTLPKELIIISTISNPLYKGFDMILHAAHFLKEQINISFRWKIYGNISPGFIERITGLHSLDNNIELCGVANAEEIKTALSSCTAYVHPSYIDNSPNSICEAQILGVPVIATNVGGVSSLVEHEKTGYLVPSNDYHLLAFYLKMLFDNPDNNISIGNTAKRIAQLRHNPDEICKDLISIYKDILKK